MSQTLLQNDVLFYQRLLKCNGLYPHKIDGKWGPKTNAADEEFSKQGLALAAQLGTFDPRSEGNIMSLTLKAQNLARRFLKVFKDQGIDVRIISGTRTYAEQDALYRKGRNGNTEPRITNAKGGQSNHNFGIAWDIGLFEGGKYITSDNKYKALAKLVKPQLEELEWDWKTFPDVPHYQHKVGSKSVADVRGLFELGSSFV